MYRARIIITVKDGEVFTIEEDLIDFTCTENLMNSNLDFTPGIFEQNATIQLYDRGDKFKRIVQRNTENFFYRSNVDIYIVTKGANDEEFEELLGNYIFDNIECDGNDNIVKINCIDYTYIFKEKKVVNAAVANRTITELLNLVFSMSLPAERWEFLDNETKTRCNSIRVDNSFVTEDNAHNVINDLCYLGMLNIVYKQGVFYVGRCA